MEDFDSFSISDDPNYYSPATEDVQTFLKQYHYSNMDESSNDSNQFPYDGIISIWRPKNYSDLTDEQNEQLLKICPDCRKNKLYGNIFSSAIKIHATQNLIESQANLLKTVCLGMSFIIYLLLIGMKHAFIKLDEFTD